MYLWWLVLVLILLFIFGLYNYIYINKKSKSESYSNLNEEEMRKYLLTTMKLIRPDIAEMVTLKIGSSSETQDKKNITLCIYDEYDNMYDFDTLIYVLLHEMAHVISSTKSGYEGSDGYIPHNNEHISNLNELIHQASQKGFIVTEKSVPRSYCQTKIKL